MGQSINSNAFLICNTKKWTSKWFNLLNYADIINQDVFIKQLIDQELKTHKITQGNYIIERLVNKINIYINISTIIDLEIINNEHHLNTIFKSISSKLNKLTNKDINLMIEKNNRVDARHLSNHIAKLVELRYSYQNIIQKLTKLVQEDKNIIGFKLQLSGRPTGAEMASISWHKNGALPLHGYNNLIDYAYSTAYTKYGTCGIKIWLNLNKNK